MASSGIHVGQHSADDTVGQVGNNHEEEDHEGGCVYGLSYGEGTNSRDIEKCSEEEGETVEDGGDTADTVDGWAETMAKILGKKTAKNKRNILIKSKQLDKIKATRRKEMLETQKQINKKQTWEMMSREKPDIVKNRETERVLQKIATRGVVQLFNSVRKHQKTTNDMLKEVGGSERKKAKILSSFSKRDFITALRKTEDVNRVSDKTEKDSAPESQDGLSWSVLREDFMMEATMKDWDKE